MVEKYIKNDLIEVCCKDEVIVIFAKKLQCAVCGMTDESKIISHGGIYMCEDCVARSNEFVERTSEEDYI